MNEDTALHRGLIVLSLLVLVFGTIFSVQAAESEISFIGLGGAPDPFRHLLCGGSVLLVGGAAIPDDDPGEGAVNATVTLSPTGTAEPDDAGDMTGDEPFGDDGVVEPDDAGDELSGDDVTPVPTGTAEPEISRMPLMGVRGSGSPVWNVSHIAGGDNITSLLDIPGLSAGDTIRIWGDGAAYEGGLTIGVSDVTVRRWEGSPEVPIITGASGTRAFTVTADNAMFSGLNISENVVSGSGAGISAAGSSGSPLQGLTITGCIFSGNEVTGSSRGGALYAGYVDDVQIENTVFEGNTAERNGGGACFYNSNDATLENTVFENNTAKFGAGTYIAYSNYVTLENATFKDNNASSEGGGAYFSGSSHNATLTGATFTNNTAKFGGGAYFQASNNITLEAETTFVNNTAKKSGGGAYIWYSDYVTLMGTMFEGNTAEGNDDDNDGGGAYFNRSNYATLVGATFKGNVADAEGGGAYFENSENATLMSTTFTSNTADSSGGAHFWNSDNANIEGTTFTSNTANLGGGGACIYYSNNATLTNTIVTSNTAGLVGGGACFAKSNNAFIANCCFDNPTNIRVSSSSATLNGTIQPGTNIIGGPYIGGNLWLTDPAQNVSEWGTEGEYEGICNESLEIDGFGTDHHPLKLNPNTDFTLAPARGTAPLSVQFTDTSTGAVTAWLWNFGDGATSTDQNPVHTYTAVGTYTVTLNASNACGWNVTTKVGAVIVTSGGGGGGGRTPASPTDTEPGQSTETGADVPNLPAAITAPDGVGVLTVPDGVVALDASGAPLQEIVITPMNTVNLDAVREAADDDASAFYFGQYAYRVEPDGATFDPPITLTFNVPIETWETLDAENVAVMWQGPDGVWETVPITSIERNETHVLVSAAISHFSVYSLFMPRIVQETPVAPPTAPTIPWIVWVVVPLIAIGIILYVWKKKTAQTR